MTHAPSGDENLAAHGLRGDAGGEDDGCAGEVAGDVDAVGSRTVPDLSLCAQRLPFGRVWPIILSLRADESKDGRAVAEFARQMRCPQIDAQPVFGR